MKNRSLTKYTILLNADCPELDKVFYIHDIEASQLSGCGCFSGVNLILKEIKDIK